MAENMTEIEPGMRAGVPVSRLTHAETRCVHGYQTYSPISADGRKLLYFEYNLATVDRRHETLKGRIVVANADGSAPRTLCETTAPWPSSGGMQHWAGSSMRVAFAYSGEPTLSGNGWKVVDVETGETWSGPGNVRDSSPDGNFLLLQTGEAIHLWAEERGESLAPEDIALREIEIETGKTSMKISVADVLAVHPEAGVARTQHLCLKQTQYSPDGRWILFALSNSTYCKPHPEEPFRHNLLVARRDGSDIRLVSQRAGHPSWFPDSTRILNNADQAGNRWITTAFPLDGSPPYALNPEWFVRGHPTIQPVAQRYMATDIYDEDGGPHRLRLYDVESGDFRDVLEVEYGDYSNDTGTHLHPAWSRDGKSLVINSAHIGPSQLYRVDVG